MTIAFRVRAAVVGAGLMGSWHADAISRVGGTVACVVDQNLVRARALAKRCGSAAAIAPNLADINVLNQVDVVHVCTPLDSHVALARQALEAGLHVLIEKPLAPTASETSGLLSLAATRGRLVCPVHQFLFQPGVQRGLLALGRLAPLLHVDTVACSAGAVRTMAGAPDELIGEIIPHPLALFARLFPAALPRITWQIEHPRDGELRAVGGVDGVSLALLVSTHGRPTMNTLRVLGAGGTLEADLFHGFAILEDDTVSRAHKIAHPFARSGQTLAAAGLNLATRAARHEPAYPGLRELISRFYRAVRGAGAPPIVASEILDVATARDALLAAIH